jgi:hypothetical protein
LFFWGGAGCAFAAGTGAGVPQGHQKQHGGNCCDGSGKPHEERWQRAANPWGRFDSGRPILYNLMDFFPLSPFTQILLLFMLK